MVTANKTDAVILIALLLIVGLVVLIIGYPSAMGDNPLKFQVKQVFPNTPFSITNNTSTGYVTFGFNTTLWVGNPCIGFIYQGNAKVDVYYRHPEYPKVPDYYLTSSSPLNDFGVADTTCKQLKTGDQYVQSQMSVLVAASSLQISDELTLLSMRSDLQKGEVTLIFEIVADYRGTSTVAAKLRVKCDEMKIMVPSGFVTGESRKACDVDWDCNKWFHFCFADADKHRSFVDE